MARTKRRLAAVGRYPLAFVVLAAALSAFYAADGGVNSGSHRIAVQTAAMFSALALLGLLGVPRVVATERTRRARIDEIDTMSGVQFEQRLAALFRYLGFRVHTTAVTGDFGADLIIERSGVRWAVQAKRYTSRVGVEAVQQVVASCPMYHAAQPVVITNQSFTAAAETLARANGVTLIGRRQLIELLAIQEARVPAPRGFGLALRQILSGVPPLLRSIGTIVGIVVGLPFVLLGLGVARRRR